MRSRACNTHRDLPTDMAKMKNRHRRMLGQARFLRTRARPTVVSFITGVIGAV